MSVKCETCEKVVASKKHLKEHLRTHSGAKPFVCELCSKGFACKGNLVKHMDMKHLGKKYQCAKCVREFTSSSLLSRHKKSAAEEGLENKCPLCCSAFKKPEKLKSHLVKVHSAEESKILQTSDVDNREGASSKPPRSSRKRKRISEAVTKSGSEDSNATNLAVDLANTTREKAQSMETVEKDDITLNYLKDLACPSNPVPHPVEKADSITHNDVTELASPTDTTMLVNQSVRGDNVTMSSQSEHDIGFIMQTWRLTLDEGVLQKFRTSSSSCVNSWQDIEFTKMVNTLVAFLRGKQNRLCSVQEMMEVLMVGPENLVGKFVVALMIVDYMSTLPTCCIGEMFEARMRLPAFHAVIENTAIYVVQRRVPKTFSSDTIDMIPGCLKDYVTLDLALLLTNDNGDEFNNIQTKQEMASFDTVKTRLAEFIFEDLDDDSIILLDKSYTSVERARSWNNLLNKYMTELRCPEKWNRQHSALEILLLSELETKINTRPYFSIKDYAQPNIETVIELHGQVLGQYCGDSALERPLAVIQCATKEDVKVFTDLLYCHYTCPEEYKGKINCGVYEIAEHVGIPDINHFLFRGNSYSCFLDYSNRLCLVHVLIKLKMDCALDDVAAHYKTIFHVSEQTTILNGLPPEDVIYFLQRPAFRRNQIDVYKVLIQWSFYASGKNCGVDDELKAEFDADAYDNFRSVYRVLHLDEMAPYYGHLCIQKFISFADIQTARSTANKILAL